ncbi:hypothetical protein HRW07_04725 [Streptomyces lunaelactis]|uniref:hypothetical protein n=1 Tax=Streptomyces lunaelactis TaxID=1535768 RepID=UPI001584D94D|nr:hypothetical protein [Streptomyces lunaelactis]NUL02558.1 hypothetical protein [Streptomyces lunaelactis]
MKTHGGPAGGAQPPLHVSSAIARGVAETAVDSISGIRTGLSRDPDVNDAQDLVPGPRTNEEQVALLRDEYTPDPGRRPPAGVPGAAEFWETTAQAAREQVFTDIRTGLKAFSASAAMDVELVGAKGDTEDRIALVRQCVLDDRPVVSISFTGSLRDLLITGNPRVMSLSILVKVPGAQLTAAVATAHSGLTADCSSAYRLRLPEGEWEELSEDTSRQPAEQGYIVLPRQMIRFASVLEEHYPHIDYVHDTCSAITEALLSHNVPVAMHYSGTVLDSAIVLVAAAHGLAVRPLADASRMLPSWKGSQLLMNTLKEGGDIPDLIVARDEMTAKTLDQRLGRGRRGRP